MTELQRRWQSNGENKMNSSEDEGYDGFFWTINPEKKTCRPPERTWEKPDYLPGLDEALEFNVPMYSNISEIEALNPKEIFVVDIESYPNYFLCAFRSVSSGKVFLFEATDEYEHDAAGLLRIMRRFMTVGFNSNFFDLVIINFACCGLNCRDLFRATEMLIVEQQRGWQVYRHFKIEALKFNHIDLIAVAPLEGSLKLYGARLHVPKLQELPFRPGTILSFEQSQIVAWYCVNADLPATAYLFINLQPQLKLRDEMSTQYGIDLRSKSDSQIALQVLNRELHRINYVEPQRPEIPAGTIIKYKAPAWLNFDLPQTKEALQKILEADFVIDENGYADMPISLDQYVVQINKGRYQLGMGGLHSREGCISYYSRDDFQIVDRDVASYYPAIILNEKLYPQHLGPSFLQVYKTLVDRRLKAKKEGNKVEADSLKITANGTFGNLGNKWSTVYAPDLLLQVTITGQLALLWLIEMLETFDIRVISANTDGVISMVGEKDKLMFAIVIELWERLTGFKTEETLYKSLHSRDVNNYIAVKTDGKVKTKGAYSERGSALDSVLSKNPEHLICSDALIHFLANGVPIMETIRNCKDIRRFLLVRRVVGGAVKGGNYLGKVIRWYYAKGERGDIVYAENGHTVPRSQGAKPLMQLPLSFPSDVDYDTYENITHCMLQEIGFTSF